MGLPNNLTLSHGDRGEYVRILQQMLVARGYFSPGLVDGHYRRSTVFAVQQFQSNNRLLPDGIAGPKTIRVLNGLPAEEEDASALDPWAIYGTAAAVTALEDAASAEGDGDKEGEAKDGKKVDVATALMQKGLGATPEAQISPISRERVQEGNARAAVAESQQPLAARERPLAVNPAIAEGVQNAATTRGQAVTAVPQSPAPDAATALLRDAAVAKLALPAQVAPDLPLRERAATPGADRTAAARTENAERVTARVPEERAARIPMVPAQETQRPAVSQVAEREGGDVRRVPPRSVQEGVAADARAPRSDGAKDIKLKEGVLAGGERLPAKTLDPREQPRPERIHGERDGAVRAAAAGKELSPKELKELQAAAAAGDGKARIAENAQGQGAAGAVKGNGKDVAQAAEILKADAVKSTEGKEGKDAKDTRDAKDGKNDRQDRKPDASEPKQDKQDRGGDKTEKAEPRNTEKQEPRNSDKSPEKAADSPKQEPQKPVEKIADKPIERVQEKPADPRPAEVAAQKPVEQTIDKGTSRIDSIDKSNEKIAELTPQRADVKLDTRDLKIETVREVRTDPATLDVSSKEKPPVRADGALAASPSQVPAVKDTELGGARTQGAALQQNRVELSALPPSRGGDLPPPDSTPGVPGAARSRPAALPR